MYSLLVKLVWDKLAIHGFQLSLRRSCCRWYIVRNEVPGWVAFKVYVCLRFSFDGVSKLAYGATTQGYDILSIIQWSAVNVERVGVYKYKLHYIDILYTKLIQAAVLVYIAQIHNHHKSTASHIFNVVNKSISNQTWNSGLNLTTANYIVVHATRTDIEKSPKEVTVGDLTRVVGYYNHQAYLQSA